MSMERSGAFVCSTTIVLIEPRTCNAVTSSDHIKEPAMNVTSWKPLSLQLLNHRLRTRYAS